ALPQQVSALALEFDGQKTGQASLGKALGELSDDVAALSQRFSLLPGQVAALAQDLDDHKAELTSLDEAISDTRGLLFEFRHGVHYRGDENASDSLPNIKNKAAYSKALKTE